MISNDVRKLHDAIKQLRWVKRGPEDAQANGTLKAGTRFDEAGQELSHLPPVNERS